MTQVNGAAKDAGDPDMFWLSANTAPTIGDYFRTANYQTHYRGKWHVTRADILHPGTQDALVSFRKNGARWHKREASTPRRIDSTNSAIPAGSARNPMAGIPITPATRRGSTPLVRTPAMDGIACMPSRRQNCWLNSI